VENLTVLSALIPNVVGVNCHLKGVGVLTLPLCHP